MRLIQDKRQTFLIGPVVQHAPVSLIIPRSEESIIVLANRLHDLNIYMLVPKCALSQFANWDPSLRTEIHLSQFAHWAPVPKLGSQFAH